MRHKSEHRTHFSELKNIDQTPMHYRYFADVQREDTDDFLIGRAFHDLVLLGKSPLVWDGRRAGKAYDAAVEANGGTDLLNETQWAAVRGMADAVKCSRLAQDILSRCPNRETYIEWDRNGVPCAGTPDAWGERTQAELKSTKSAHPYRFKREASWRRYPEQVAWYDVGLGTKFEFDATDWRDNYIIAVEKKAPYPVAVFRVTPLRLLQAHNRVDSWIEKREACLRDKCWPGWDSSVEDIDADIIDDAGDFE